jgi:diketogulonate reductase-like aldo/keto reductase
MKTTEIPEVLLSSGHKMPLIGMGTVAVPLPPSEIIVPVFINAIEIGYRHFDSASLYGSEESLGQAVAEALDRGLLSSREDLFITSKLWCPDAHHDLVLPALKKSLQ